MEVLGRKRSAKPWSPSAAAGGGAAEAKGPPAIAGTSNDACEDVGSEVGDADPEAGLGTGGRR